MSLDTDTMYPFTQTINTPQLLDEISTAGLPAPDVIQTNFTAVQIYYSSPLSSDQQTTLTNVVANHVANSSYVTLAQQAASAILSSYLTNTSVVGGQMVEVTARIVIINAIANKLPLEELLALNAAIRAQVGF